MSESVDFYEQEAKRGSAEAQFQLAIMYARGAGVKQDPRQSVRWYRKAAEQGLPKAQVQLAHLYYHGEGLPKDYERAAEWYRRAAENGDNEASRQLALMYADGIGVPRDLSQAIDLYRRSGETSLVDQLLCDWHRTRATEGSAADRLEFGKALLATNVPGLVAEGCEWIKTAADEGYGAAQLCLAEMYRVGEGVSQDQEQMLFWLMRAARNEVSQAALQSAKQQICEILRASEDPEDHKLLLALLNKFIEQNDQDAIVEAAEINRTGAFLPAPNFPEACRLYDLAAREGNKLAQFWSAAIKLEHMQLGPLERELAMTVIEDCAERGLAPAQYMLGVLLSNDGDPQGVTLLNRAARQQYLDAFIALGDVYQDGKLVSRDLMASAENYRRAALANSVTAQFKLGKLYLQSTNSEIVSEGVMWCEKAATQGDVAASILLSDLLQAGQVLPRDPVRALAWLVRASEQGSSEALYKAAMLLQDAQLGQPEYKEIARLLTAAAEQGHAEALAALALLYVDGKGVESDFEEAVDLFMQSAALGNCEAFVNLGDCYFYGRGTDCNEAIAVEYYQKAAKMGSNTAQLLLADCCYFGDGREQDISEALHWYHQAAEAGNEQAQFNLGMMYSKGDDIPIDLEAGVAWFMRAAESGHAFAQYMLGEHYLMGRGVEQDDTVAERWFSRAATNGLAKAQSELASLCCGQGRWDEAVYWYEQAAAGDDKKAVACLAEIYYEGPERLRNMDRAFTLYLAAAEDGYPPAQYNLSLMLSRGQGASRSEEKAILWLRRAAAAGMARAQLTLAVKLATGTGVEANPSEAFEWCQKAARLGDAGAQMFLATMYADGVGTERDDQQCLHWLRVAAEAGNAHAKYELALRLLARDPDGNLDEATELLRDSRALGRVEADEILARIDRKEIAAGR